MNPELPQSIEETVKRLQSEAYQKVLKNETLNPNDVKNFLKETNEIYRVVINSTKGPLRKRYQKFYRLGEDSLNNNWESNRGFFFIQLLFSTFEHATPPNNDRSDLYAKIVAAIRNEPVTPNLTQDRQTLQRNEARDAYAKCAAAILEEPLIPSLDKNAYRSLVNISESNIREALTKKDPTLGVLQTYSKGVIYNTTKFCPEALPLPVSEGSLENTKKFFDWWMLVLQGIA